MVTGSAKYLGSVAEPCFFAETVRSLREFKQMRAATGISHIMELHKMSLGKDRFKSMSALYLANGTVCYEYAVTDGQEHGVLTTDGLLYVNAPAPWKQLCEGEKGEETVEMPKGAEEGSVNPHEPDSNESLSKSKADLDVQNLPNEPVEAPTRVQHSARPASLAEQKLCSEQAEKVFKKWASRDSLASSFQSRYDPSQSICYVEMDEGEPLPRGLSFVIVDAFGNTTYGNYEDSWRKSEDSGPNEEKPLVCWVKPPGPGSESKILCGSVHEFNDLVVKFFDIDIGM